MRTCSSHPHCLMLPTYWTDSANQICHLERPGGNPTGAEALSSPEESRSGGDGWGPSRRLVRDVRLRLPTKTVLADVSCMCSPAVCCSWGSYLWLMGAEVTGDCPVGWQIPRKGIPFPLPVQVWKPGALPAVPPCYQPVYQWHSSPLTDDVSTSMLAIVQASTVSEALPLKNLQLVLKRW